MVARFMSISEINDEELVKQISELLLIETWEGVEGKDNDGDGSDTGNLVIKSTRMPEHKAPDRKPRINDFKEIGYFFLFIF